MVDPVGAVDQFSHQRFAFHASFDVLQSSVIEEMLEVATAAGRQVVDHNHPMTVGKESFR